MMMVVWASLWRAVYGHTLHPVILLYMLVCLCLGCRCSRPWQCWLLLRLLWVSVVQVVIALLVGMLTVVCIGEWGRGQGDGVAWQGDTHVEEGVSEG